ncbi:MAG: 6,7-dimethyl-8-ribityllumazine synthase [Dehalococcoidia bacterium]|jgi:6,7-dimethyl-8-ribityllumazine synthase|nr:6,7-dimethyl-8-ribityllumazine synthase [Dehalococcoidia bacterium]MDP7469551.1 6,7-dimethyl-8-ribityllumazine synthase [Dehalococcoidia bacterium]
MKYQGALLGAKLRFALVVSRFNELISFRLLDGAQDCLLRHGVREADIDVALTPGSFEIPLVAKNLAASGRYQGVVCLGAVIRGDTPHFDFIASEVAKGVALASLDTGVPVIFGVVTADNLEQAIERGGVKEGNKGFQAAMSALEMANLMKNLGVVRRRRGRRPLAPKEQ